MSKPLVSIIIPAYNASNYIFDCVSSLQDQTFSNLQIIIVNDGSEDNTLEIVTKIAKSDQRIEVINQHNKGCSAAKNKGLQYVKGDFVQYIDADDMLSNDKIEKQVNELNNNQNSIAVCKTVVFKKKIDDTNLEIDTDLISKGGTGKEFLMRLWGSEGKSGMVQPNSYLVPINIINSAGKWDESISPSPDEDGEYFARILLESDKVIFTKGVNYYRKIDNEWSLSKSNSLNHAIGLYKTIKKKFEPLINANGGDIFKYYYTIQLTNCAYQFGNYYTEIFTLVEEEFKKYNIKKYKVINNTNFAKTANIIGFRNAMTLRKIFFSKK